MSHPDDPHRRGECPDEVRVPAEHDGMAVIEVRCAHFLYPLRYEQFTGPPPQRIGVDRYL
jgi:hypothetical protein